MQVVQDLQEIANQSFPPYHELESMFQNSSTEKKSFTRAFSVGKVRIMAYTLKPDPFVPLLVLEWMGEIAKENTSDIRVFLAEVATEKPPVLLMDFTSLKNWGEVTDNLVAGFIGALASKKVFSLLFQPRPGFEEKLEERKLTAHIISSLDSKELLRPFQEKVVFQIFPKGREDFKGLPAIAQRMVNYGYFKVLVNLEGKALRGDDMEGLLEIYKAIKEKGGFCFLLGVTEEMKTVFKIMELEELKTIVRQSAEEALQEMGEELILMDISI